MSGPTSTITNGSYTVSWTPSQFVNGVSSRYIDRYELFQNGGLFSSMGPLVTSVSFSGKGDGTYGYQARACNSAGCSGFNANYNVTVLWPPGIPGAFTVPQDSGPSYMISWTPQPFGAPAPQGSGRSDRYDLGESTDGINWPAPYSVVGTSKAFSGKPWGSKFWYRVRACNPSGCSAYTDAKSIDIVSSLTTVAEQTPPTFTPPAQGWVGTIPGTPSVEGGAASYRIPIEVPLGRAGMQPEIALTYSSRNGNGVAGVGWALSGTRSIYRCPRTLAQEAGNRPVLHDISDRLCLDGQRLVGPTDGMYGLAGTEYRTEVDQFARITLKNADRQQWSSYFDVEEKSGRVSRFEPVQPSTLSAPDTWYLRREYDRQGNCITYNYETRAMRGSDPERVLTSIAYTGTMSGDQCLQGTVPRTIELVYTSDREDKRTTYRFGVASPSTVRLDAILTKVGGNYVRQYQLAYKASSATRRSLLQNVTLMCAGTICDVGQLPPTSFTYQEEQQSFDFWHATLAGQPLGPDWRASVTGDFDGDGALDHLYTQQTATGRNRSLELTSCPQSISLNESLALASNKGLDIGNVEMSEDVHGNGKADIIGSLVPPGQTQTYLAFSNVNCSGVDASSTLFTNMQIAPGSPQTYVTTIDYDGDGILDARTPGTSSGTETIVRRRTRDATDWVVNVNSFSSPAAPNSSMTAQMTRDMNGDGLVDTVFDTPIGTPQPTKLTFFAGLDGVGVPSYGTYLVGPDGSANPNLGGPSGSFADPSNKRRRWIDVNGDGLPDIYEPGAIWLNQGGRMGNAQMFRRVPITVFSGFTAIDRKRAELAFAMDVDGDGQEELMIPDYRTIWYCGGDPTAQLPNGSGDPALFCGDDFDSPLADRWRSQDRSVFKWDAYKFVELNDGTYMMIRVPSNLQAPVNADVAPVNWNGDGMNDLVFALFNGADTYHQYSGLAATELGPRISRGQARAPDLLIGVTNGLGATASWVHQPLSLPANLQAQVSGCDMPEPFYVAHHDDPKYPRSPGYVFFTSSMWTVSRFDVSNGLGTGTNKTCYRYQDAMLNSEGRGFQGFKVIIAEEQLPLEQLPPLGEHAAPGYAGCGGTCSPNNLRTRTEFNQEFPLTSKVQRVTVALAKSLFPNETILSETTYWWHAEQPPGSSGAWVVYSPATVKKKFDLPQPLNGSVPLLSETKTATEIQFVSGEPARSCVLVGGETPVPSSATQPRPGSARGVINVDTRTIENDTVNWWLGKLTSHAVVSDFYDGSISLNQDCFISGTLPQKCPATPSTPSPTMPPRNPPTCPALTQSPDAKVHTTNYGWYADGPPSPSARKLRTEEIVASGVSEATSTFQYGNFGNVSTRTVTARNVSPGPVTTYTYTGDGYFLATQTNPAGHALSLETDPKTGLITRRQEVQNGPATTMTYDSLGRVLDVKTDGLQTLAYRLSTCAVGNCVLKRQSIQQGAPTKTEYLDRLGRLIATGVESFATQGTSSFEIVTKVSYNERGAKIAEFQPWKSGTLAGAWDGTSGSPYSTQYSRIDAFGRVGSKKVVRGPIFEAGRGEATLTTTYIYQPAASGTGLQTLIAVDRPLSQGGSIKMSRTYDRRGKLVETTQDVSTPSPHTVLASYFYDPAGNLTMIADAAPTPNKLTATYDNLGRKTSMVDPDRGTWIYTWDGLGRLDSQTDAKAIIISHKYDGIGRLQQRFLKTSADPSPVLESTWQYDLNGRFGTLSAMIGNENPAAGADNFRRDYLYDPLLRPFRVTTHVPGAQWSARDFAVEYGHDHAYGRLKAMSYPGPDLNTPGEMISFDYDSRGNLLGETTLITTATRGTTYRTVRDMSVRGQVTLQDFGNRIRETAQYDESTGVAVMMNAFGLADAAPTGCPPPARGDEFGSPLLAREADYTYDHFLNLAVQKKQLLLRNGTAIQFSGCTPLAATVSESYQHDELQRLVSESRSWSGMTPLPDKYADQYAYDDLGNITKKDDYGDVYTYGHGITVDGAGPHAVVSVSKGGVNKTFTYDPNGNLFAGDGRTITFDNLDRPIRVTLNGVTTDFRYAPDGSRYLQRTTGIPSSPSSKIVYYVDKGYERIEWPAATEEKTYIGPSVVIYRNGAARDIRYLHLDRLGSTDTVTNGGGFEYLPDAHGYDAFGKPRARDWQSSSEKLHTGGDYNVTTEHGFTGHEHLDDTYLIHMNGRVYDYRLGRFLSVDPIISNPANSQSINPYSYIGNNPLSGVDPTGYVSCDMVAGTHICNNNPIGNVSINGNPIPRSVVSGPATRSTPPSPSSTPGQSGNGSSGQQSRPSTSNASDGNSPQETAKTDAETHGNRNGEEIHWRRDHWVIDPNTGERVPGTHRTEEWTWTARKEGGWRSSEEAVTWSDFGSSLSANMSSAVKIPGAIGNRVRGSVYLKDRWNAEDWMTVGERFALGIIASRQVASQLKEFTAFEAAGVFLHEVVSANEGSEFMTGMVFRSAARTAAYGFVLGQVYSAGIELEVDLYDRVATSTRNDIYQVLLRSYGGRSP